MYRLIAPISRGYEGPDVVNLHDALRYLMANNAIEVSDNERKRLLMMLAGESEAAVFKDGTQRILQIFQEQRGLEGHGEVDEDTANLLNELIDAGGGFDEEGDERSILVFGLITESGNRPIEGLIVSAYGRSPFGIERQLGKETITNAEGSYRLMMTRHEYEAMDRRPALFIRVFSGEKMVGESANFYDVGSRLRIDVLVKADTDDSSDPEYQVNGAAFDERGEPLEGVLVQAFDRDLRHEELLGSARVHRGEYEIRYRRSQLGRAKKIHADLFLKVLSPENRVLHQTDVLYRAPEVARIDIVLGGGALQEPSRFEELTTTLLPLLGDVRPQDLREDDEVQDVSFLSGETQLTPDSIIIWMLCHRLADKTQDEGSPLEAADFYAFLYQGQPSVHYDGLLEDYKHPERVALLEEKLLRGLVDLGATRQRELLEQALDENLVPIRIRFQIDQILRSLETYRLRFTRDTPFGAGKGTIGQLLSLVPSAAESETKIISRLVDHTGSMSEFWKKLETDEVLAPETVREVRLSFELSELSRNHIPLVEAVTSMIAEGKIANKYDLARYSRDDWKQLFSRNRPDGNPIGIPENIDGETEEERQDHFAAILDARFERAYPTTAFSSKLQRQKKSPLPARKDLVRFLDHNPAFHLDRHRVDHYLAAHPEALEGVDDEATMVRDLKAVQRVFKLHPKHAVVDALINNGIDSAQQIYFKGPVQFSAMLKDTEINRIEARRLYAKAENAYAMALNLFGDNNIALNGQTPAAVPALSMTEETQTLVTALPNLQAPFGSLDNCECSHCQSVYSPAAHFVDILRFLRERNSQGTDVHAGKNVLQVLLERRPDLGEIELSCENTNTPLPYIDLVSNHPSGTAVWRVHMGVGANSDLLRPEFVSDQLPEFTFHKMRLYRRV